MARTLSANTLERIRWIGLTNTRTVLTCAPSSLASFPGASQRSCEILAGTDLTRFYPLRNVKRLDLFFVWRKAFKDKAIIPRGYEMNGLQFACAGIETTARTIAAQMSWVQTHGTESGAHKRETLPRPRNEDIADLNNNKHLTFEISSTRQRTRARPRSPPSLSSSSSSSSSPRSSTSAYPKHGKWFL